MDPISISRRGIASRELSGPHLICLMYVGVKRVAPEHYVQMDLNDSFLAALQLNNASKEKT